MPNPRVCVGGAVGRCDVKKPHRSRIVRRGSALARRSIQRRVALRRLFPALPPVSDVLLGQCRGGAPRIGPCLCFVDQAKRPIEQLRRLLAARGSRHPHVRTVPSGSSFTSAQNSLVRASGLNSCIQVSERAASSKRQSDEDVIAHGWVIDFHLTGRINNGHS